MLDNDYYDWYDGKYMVLNIQMKLSQPSWYWIVNDGFYTHLIVLKHMFDSL